MKRLLSTVCLVLATATVLVPVAEAKRLGGGGTSGMKRTLPPKAPDSVPAKPGQTPPANAAAPTAGAAPAAAAAAAAPKRSWMGPIAGLAAGLGIAALMSHLGMGAAMGNILTMLLIAAVAFFAIRFLMRRFSPQQRASNLQFAGAGAGAGSGGNNAPAWQPAQPSPVSSGSSSFAPAAPVAAAAGDLPAGFDTEGFERIAKLIFIRMQAANDAGDLNDLRAFTTPEMFAAARLDLQDRNGATQQTDVVQLNAQVVDYAEEAAQQVVSVRFHGLIREEKDAAASTFDEVWHLVKPHDGSREWAIAGIAPYA
jgi:predicted lipid-binding transport protein (Tim44 family)